MFNDFIDNLIKEGKCCFHIDYAASTLGKSKEAIRSSIAHMLAKGQLSSPAKSFYVIVPPEYRKLGCLPAPYFLPYLMESLKLKYYIGLLSAASYYGASHQAVQVCQVFIEKKKEPLVCGGVKIKFITKKDISKTPIKSFNTPKSFIRVSTAEATIMDMLNYISQSGGLNHIVTILSELCESITPKELKSLIDKQPLLPWKQRLGYLLDHLEQDRLSKIVENYLKSQNRVDFIPLYPGIEADSDCKKNENWKIIENTNIESDI